MCHLSFIYRLSHEIRLFFLPHLTSKWNKPKNLSLLTLAWCWTASNSSFPCPFPLFSLSAPKLGWSCSRAVYGSSPLLSLPRVQIRSLFLSGVTLVALVTFVGSDKPCLWSIFPVSHFGLSTLQRLSALQEWENVPSSALVSFYRCKNLSPLQACSSESCLSSGKPNNFKPRSSAVLEKETQAQGLSPSGLAALVPKTARRNCKHEDVHHGWKQALTGEGS